MPEVELHAVEQSASSSDCRDSALPEATLISPRANDTVVMDTFDKFVLVLVIPALVVAAYFNIKACVDAYENPATQVSVINANRTFPGIMICPYSFNANRYFLGDVRVGLCPKWASDATLSFTFAPGLDSIRLWNTNTEVASKRQSASECPNVLSAVDPSGGNSYLLYPPFPVPKRLDGFLDLTSGLKVTVKNTEKPTLSCEFDYMNPSVQNPCKNPADADTFPYLCPSWTPPQVECLVFDPNHFEEQAKKHGIDPKCNPLKEIKPNSLESVQMSFGAFGMGDPFKKKTGYAYKGLIPQPNATNKAFRDLPQNFFISTNDMFLKDRNVFDMNISFNGLTAVIYDASNGIPKELDFSGATTRTMSEQVDSLIVFAMKCDDQSNVQSCGAEPLMPQEVEVTTTFEEIFTNQLRTQSTRYYNQSVVTAISNLPRTVGIPNTFLNIWSLSMSFSTDTSTNRKQVLSVNIVTTVSVILSIATSIWGARPKIKEAIQVASAKAQELLFKRGSVIPAQKPSDPILVFARA
jgi:hypothetical protein